MNKFWLIILICFCLVITGYLFYDYSNSFSTVIDCGTSSNVGLINLENLMIQPTSMICNSGSGGKGGSIELNAQVADISGSTIVASGGNGGSCTVNYKPISIQNVKVSVDTQFNIEESCKFIVKKKEPWKEFISFIGLILEIIYLAFKIFQKEN